MREISVALAELENKNLLPKTNGDPKVGSSSGDTIVPLPTFNDEDEDNIYLPPSEYAEYTPKAPKPPIRIVPNSYKTLKIWLFEKPILAPKKDKRQS